MKQVIRIIGGLYRGKKLQFPEVEGLRPTPDRVRETLFNWLMNDIREARCLDAFAGSGALGFEAFSRGAANVVLIEQSPTAHANLKKIASQFDSLKLRVIKGDSRAYLKQSTEQFDIIFLDPPYALNYLPECLNDLAQNDVLVKGGLVYLEAPNELEVNGQHWNTLKLKKAGQIVFGLLQKI